MADNSPSVTRRETTESGASNAHRGRLVAKSGDIKVVYDGAAPHSPISNVLVFMSLYSWRRLLLIYILVFASSWIIFAILYYMVSSQHGNIDRINNFASHESQNVSRLSNAALGSVCVIDLNDFKSSLLFSIETQHTIGYGGRRPTLDCFATIVLLIIQSITALFIQNITAQAVYMKFARPHKNPTSGIYFDPTAYLKYKDGFYQLQFEVANYDRSEIIHARIRALCYRHRRTSEGEVIKYHCSSLNFIQSFSHPLLCIPVPIRLVHVITSESPLFGLGPENFMSEKFEIVVCLDGIYEATGFPCHFRSSYLNNEIVVKAAQTANQDSTINS